MSYERAKVTIELDEYEYLKEQEKILKLKPLKFRFTESNPPTNEYLDMEISIENKSNNSISVHTTGKATREFVNYLKSNKFELYINQNK